MTFVRFVLRRVGFTTRVLCVSVTDTVIVQITFTVISVKETHEVCG